MSNSPSSRFGRANASSSSPEGGFLVLSADDEIEPLGKQALVSTLRGARGDAATKLIIKVQEQAILQSLVDGMDSGTIAGYEEIEVTQVEDF